MGFVEVNVSGRRTDPNSCARSFVAKHVEAWNPKTYAVVRTTPTKSYLSHGTVGLLIANKRVGSILSDGSCTTSLCISL